MKRNTTKFLLLVGRNTGHSALLPPIETDASYLGARGDADDGREKARNIVPPRTAGPGVDVAWPC